ncbi:unnamed protein product, partial [Polarella glacialis]
ANLPYLYLCPDESNRGGETHAAVGLEDLVCVSKCPVSIEGSITKKFCPQSPLNPDYPTIPVARSACFPTDTDMFQKLSDYGFRGGLLGLISSMVDVAKVWPVIVLCALMSMGLSFAYIKLLSQNPAGMFWGTFTIFTVVVGSISIYTMLWHIRIETNLGSPLGVFRSVEFYFSLAALLLVIGFSVVVQSCRWTLNTAFAAIE